MMGVGSIEGWRGVLGSSGIGMEARREGVMKNRVSSSFGNKVLSVSTPKRRSVCVVMTSSLRRRVTVSLSVPKKKIRKSKMSVPMRGTFVVESASSTSVIGPTGGLMRWVRPSSSIVEGEMQE